MLSHISHIPKTWNIVHIPCWVLLDHTNIMGGYWSWRGSYLSGILASSSRWLDRPGEWVEKICHSSWRVDCDARYRRLSSGLYSRESIRRIRQWAWECVIPNVFQYLPIFMFFILKGMGNEIFLSFRVKWNEKRKLALYFSGLPRFIVIRSQWWEYWRN